MPALAKTYRICSPRTPSCRSTAWNTSYVEQVDSCKCIIDLRPVVSYMGRSEATTTVRMATTIFVIPSLDEKNAILTSFFAIYD